MTLQTDKRDEALLEDVASLFDMYAHDSEAFATGQKYVRYTLESELYPHDIPHRKLRSAPVLRNRVGALVNHAKGVRY